MLEGVVFRHVLQFFRVFPEERPAGAGQNQAAHLAAVAAAHQALENGGMLRIHRDDLRSVLPCGRHDERAAADERFLVRKGNALFLPDGRQRGAQAQHPDHRRHDRVRLLVLRRGEALHAGEDADLLPRQRVTQLLRRLRRGHDRKLRAEFAALLRHALDVASGGQRRNADGKLLDDLQRLPADGAGGAEDRYALCHITLPQTE